MLADAETTTHPAFESAHRAVATAARPHPEPDNLGASLRAQETRRALAAEAAEAGPLAIAAATTDLERSIIQRIFAAIPEVLALSDAHSDADAFDKPSVGEAYAAWDAAYDAVNDLAGELVDLPPETAADAMRRIRLFRQIQVFIEGMPPTDNLAVGLHEQDFEVMGKAAIAALKALAERVPDSRDWQSALAGYETACAEALVANAKAAAAEAELERTMSVPETLRLGPGRWYFSAEAINRDVVAPHGDNDRLTAEQAAEKLVTLSGFLPRYEHERERLQIEALESAYDAALVRRRASVEAIINTPAPTQAAALSKVHLLLSEWHGADDAEMRAEMIAGSDAEAWAMARIMEDAIRLGVVPVSA